MGLKFTYCYRNTFGNFYGAILSLHSNVGIIFHHLILQELQLLLQKLLIFLMFQQINLHFFIYLLPEWNLICLLLHFSFHTLNFVIFLVNFLVKFELLILQIVKVFLQRIDFLLLFFFNLFDLLIFKLNSVLENRVLNYMFLYSLLKLFLLLY